MARITVEDALPLVPNRFELVVLAARRARELSLGERPLVARDNDKNTIVALREIAAGAVSPDALRGRIVEQMASPPADERLPDPEVIMDLASAGVAEEDGEGDDASDDGGPDGSLAD
jgi:DNA-directed RNA polymerase subunit omega